MKSRTLRIRHTLFLGAFLFGIFGVSWGQTTYDWLSTAPDGNWKQGSGGARWSGGFWDQPPYGIIRFNNNHQLSMTNNVSGPYDQFQLIFGSSNNTSRTINGSSSNTVRFSDFAGTWPRVDNQSAATHTINFPLIVNSGGTWNLELATNNSSTGKIIFGSNATISNNSSKILFIYGNGATNSDRYIELDGVISGNGSLQIKLGGIARMGANHSYTGSTNIEHGELWIDNGGDLSSTSSVNLGLSSNMSSIAKLFISDSDGGTTFLKNITVSDGNSSTRFIGGLNSSGVNYFSGLILRSGSNNLVLESVDLNGTIEFTNEIQGTGDILKNGLGNIVLSGANTYTGLTTINAGILQLNKTGGGTLPSGNSITVNNGGTLRISSNQTLADLTINSGGTVLIDAGVQLTITGTLTNNGTFTLENGATLKQGTSVTGGGTYNIKQNLDNCSNNSTSLTGRYWYLGSPVTSLRENSFGNAGNLNKVWSFTNGAYTAIGDGATLVPTTGYVHRRGTNASPLTFTGTNLYATDETIQLSNNAGTYGGWHLIANPYTAYLDWQQVAGSNLSSNLSNTYYIRSYNASGSGDVNALISYNSSTGLESNTSSLSLTSAQAQYIAPMQAFWVKVNPTTPLSATAGQLRLERAFTSHQTGNVGLKSSTIFPTLARVNLVDGGRFDQMLVFMNQDMSNGVDQFDSEKMFVSGAPQIYTMAAGKKLVMNGLKNNKKKISIPLYLELPQSKVYNLQLADFNLEAGLILLEDKQEGTIQDFTIHDVYSFYANSGIVQNRFVLHFFMPDATITAQGPSNSWVAEEGSYTEGGNVQITADSKGKVQISLDQPETDKIEGSVQVTDANGRIVHSGALEGLTTLFELNVPTGIYYLTVQSGHLIENKKLFIQD